MANEDWGDYFVTRLSAVADKHKWFAHEIGRLQAALVSGNPQHDLLQRALNAASTQSKIRIETPLRRDPPLSGEEEQLSALVLAAHREARLIVRDGAGGGPDSKSPLVKHHESLGDWAERVFFHAHTDLNTDRYGELDVCWAEALWKRLVSLENKTDRIAFPTHHVLPLRSTTLGDDAPFTIAVAGDWGTGVTESDLVAARMMAHKPDITIHLGDVYYAGTHAEEARFVDRWPAGSYTDAPAFTLNSNHEMYSGGKAYFEVALAKGGKFDAQRGLSYFAMQNKSFVIIGLDTAYFDSDFFYSNGTLDEETQIPFIKEILDGAGDRRVVLFTHHNGLTVDNEPTELMKVVSDLLGDRSALWIWGHLHAAMAHEPYRPAGHPKAQVYGRCVGHGGIPYTPFSTQEAARYAWGETELADDAHEEDRALNGYYILTLQGSSMSESFYDERGRRRWSAAR